MISKKLIIKIFEHTNTVRTDIMKDYSKELGELADEISYTNLKLALYMLEPLLIVLESEAFRKDLEKCFQK